MSQIEGSSTPEVNKDWQVTKKCMFQINKLSQKVLIRWAQTQHKMFVVFFFIENVCSFRENVYFAYTLGDTLPNDWVKYQGCLLVFGDNWYFMYSDCLTGK